MRKRKLKILKSYFEQETRKRLEHIEELYKERLGLYEKIDELLEKIKQLENPEVYDYNREKPNIN